MDLVKYGLCEIKQMLVDGKTSAAEVTSAALEQIDKTSNLNTLITVCRDSAKKAAKESDGRIRAGKARALEGIPVIVKDNISTCGIRTTCASKFLENYVPPYNAFVVDKLLDAGAIIVGKANMDEFAMGSANENSAYGAVKNAVNPLYVPGGSSGGSASSVAAFQGYAALGSDTGGSIRQPAAYCGVVGLKPTYSTVSRFGLVAFASSLDQIGPLARSVRDCALMMNVISGYDKNDSTSFSGAYPDYTAFSADIKGKRVGIAKEFLSDGLDGAVKASITSALETLKGMGATVVETSIKSFSSALATYYVLSSAEAASNLARYDGVKYGLRVGGEDYIDMYYNSRTKGFGDEVKRRIMVGNYVLSSGYYDAYYLKATKVRTLIKQDFENAFKDCDVLLCPTAPTTAFKLGQKVTDHTKVYLEDIYTVPVNIAGLPAISVPFKKAENGMPVGLQFIGKPYDEVGILGFAAALEKAEGGNK